jgi:mRNA interferase MazF
MTVRQGEIWLVDLDPTVGDEIRKTRPTIVVSRDELGTLGLRVVVPITAWQDRFRDAENNLAKPSTADTFQVRSVSTRRFVRRLGQLSDADFQRVRTGLSDVFER